MIARDELERHAVRDPRRGLISLKLDLPVMGGTSDVIVSVPLGAEHVSDKSICTINDLLAMGDDARRAIRQLLFDDAGRTAQEVAFGDPERMRGGASKHSFGFFDRLFKKGPPKFEFVAIELDDPRHPCYFENGITSVDAKVKWVSAHIYEQDETPHRYARLFCYPEWETEHGVCVAVRNGVPVGLIDFQDVFDPLGTDGWGQTAD